MISQNNFTLLKVADINAYVNVKYVFKMCMCLCPAKVHICYLAHFIYFLPCYLCFQIPSVIFTHYIVC